MVTLVHRDNTGKLIPRCEQINQLKHLVFMMIMILIGWNVFLVAEANGAMNATKSNVPNPFNAFVYSLEVFVPLVDLHQESYWLPDANAAYGWLLRLYFWVHIALGWISSTLLVAALTGLVRKE